MIYKSKLTIGILLLICTCLPLGSCQKEDIAGIDIIEKKIDDNELKTQDDGRSISKPAEQDYLIPIMQIDSTEPGSLIFFMAFIWPIPFLLITQRRFKAPVKKRIVHGFESVFSAFSAYVIYSFVFKLWYEPMIWGYLSFILVSIYLLISLYELLFSIFSNEQEAPESKP